MLASPAIAPRLTPTKILDDVRMVLKAAATGKGTDRVFLSAYQILDRLPPAIRQRLLTERAGAGRGTGKYYGAASVVSDAAEMLLRQGELDAIPYVETEGLQFRVDGSFESAGNRVCGLYRLKPGTP